MTLPVRIRSFDDDDIEAVIELWTACGLVRPWNDPRKDIQRKRKVRPDLFLVAVHGDTIVGSCMAGYEGHRGWVNYLAVSPTHRRRGIGRQLMAEVESRLRDDGCPKINLQVRGENHEAIAFYRAIGYDHDDVISLGKRLVED